jgi:riboflavin kinase/FMN adenylyltransferase
MEIVTGYGAIAAPDSPIAATIGNFDGVHLGHQALLAEARRAGARLGLPAAVVTFDPHPLRILAPERAPRMILTRRQKIEVLAVFGIDLIVFIPFTHEIAAVPAEAFVRRFLVERLRVACLVVGEDFRFGKGRAGDLAMLRGLAPECGFEVRTVPPVGQNGERISASQVRRAIGQGDMARAAALMGRAYVLTGQVVRGHGRGKGLRAPTANLAPDNELLPADGVYITETLVELEWHPSVTNVGSRPTFEGAGFAIETHLPDFEGSLYNEKLRIRFFERIRDERKFDSVEALRAQIASDIGAMRRWFAGPSRADRTGRP